MNSDNPGFAPDNVPVIKPHITSRLIGDEAFLMNLDSLDTYILNDTAARVWGLIDGQRSMAGISKTIQSEYDVTADECDASVSRLFTDFAAAGLIGPKDIGSDSHG